MYILVVDDDPLAGEMTAAILEAQGHQPLIANDAMAAVEQLNTHSDIALIVSDMHMPLINGLELLEMLQEQSITLPFILLTGDTLDATRSQPPGLNACLSKDAELMSTLAQAINQALAQHAGP